MDFIYQLFSHSTPKDITMRQEFTLTIGERTHRVQVSDYTPKTTLNEYLRESLYLTGTKYMCRKGGCGVCNVTATALHPVTGNHVTFVVNSCLVALFTCENWTITTIEGISTVNPNKPDEPIHHQIQNVMVRFNGTQCGFCSAGMIMTMYAILEEKGSVTMQEVEDSFGGNICRCTGYRPIASAFKSLASDANKALIGNYPDVEDILPCKFKEICKMECKNACQKGEKLPFYFKYDTGAWYKVYTVSEIVELFTMYPDSVYMLVSGNTSKGVYSIPPDTEIYIDITNVEELLSYTLADDKLELGANMSLTEVMQLFSRIASEEQAYSYLTKIVDHIDLIATVAVRNLGSLAGNLTMKHNNPEFPSDIFLILETIGATVIIVDTELKETSVSAAEYLRVDMKHKIMTKIVLPPLNDTYKYESYKIMPRAQNAHAMVNAGFLLQFDSNGEILSARIVYGCINPSFIHATNTEAYLKGNSLFKNEVLQKAMKILDNELHPDYILPDPTPEFRKKLAISLFFKYVLSIAKDAEINPRNKTGGQKLTRPISTGTQDYETHTSLYPLTEPITKLEAYAQVSGQAEYIMDKPDLPGQLYGALVLARAKPYSFINSINTEKALNMEGVVAFYGSGDIPGINSFSAYQKVAEELFCDGTVKYYDQPVGIIVAKSQTIAEAAASLVTIDYKSSEATPLFTVRAVLEADDQSRLTLGATVEPTGTGTNVTHVITGSHRSGMQYHYHMETQCCSIVPIEDGLDVYAGTQWMDLIQASIAENLNIDANKINVKIRRLGGAYGAKISRNGLITNAAALAAYKLQKPVKMWTPFDTNMEVVGKRAPLTADYSVGVNDDGVIQYLIVTLYSDYGYCGGNEDMITEIVELVKSGYVTDTFKITPFSVKTDMHTNTWCRAPGTTEGLALIEGIFEHISYVINRDPFTVRLANINQMQHPNLLTFCNDLIKWADITRRKEEIKQFNTENRWRKKGISIVPMSYPFQPFGNWYVIISIYQSDGTVAICHGGVEMGQGINTKAAQVCAYALGIPINTIQVKPTNNLISPNATSTGGSATSEAICYAILKAAEILNERMAPVKEKLNNPTWKQVVQQCFAENIGLSASYSFNPAEVAVYNIYAVCAAEVEVDILTGLYNITRVDLLEDTGESMSPLIDIGQVEGAFIMGQGLWTTEEIIIGKEGQILTNSTWTYKPPGMKDIPIDFRVKFPANNPNPVGVLNSKATAEPPLCVSCVIPLAIRNALASARTELGDDVEKWYAIDGPSTVENTFLNSLPDYTKYTL